MPQIFKIIFSSLIALMNPYDLQPTNTMTSIHQNQISERLQLFFSCKDLHNFETFGTTNPFLVVSMHNPITPKHKILQTAVHTNDLNPKFIEALEIKFFFQIQQFLTFQVFHSGTTPKLIGKAQCTIGQIIATKNSGFQRNLIDQEGQQRGSILVLFEKCRKQPNKKVSVKVSAKNLYRPSRCFLCPDTIFDPFFIIVRNIHEKQTPVHRSNVIHKNKSPSFDKFQVSETKLAHNNVEYHLKAKFYHHEDKKNIDSLQLLGVTQFNLSQIRENKQFEIQNDFGIKATCSFSNFQTKTQYQFTDYLLAGVQLALVTCIDFTASNKCSDEPQSLHYMTGNSKSQYLLALQQVVKILIDYDLDKYVPLYGFGAKVNFPTFQSPQVANHFFPLNGNRNNPNVYQVEGIVQAYRQALPYLQFDGPTYFSPILDNAIKQAVECKASKDKYFIILILTDGQINDEEKVIDQIIACCQLPISVIIIGIGEGDFSKMEKLNDNDMKLVSSHGVKTTRDLVQFVKFNTYKNNPVELARNVLLELPRQLKDYYTSVGVTPKDIGNPNNYRNRELVENISRLAPQYHGGSMESFTPQQLFSRHQI